MADTYLSINTDESDIIKESADKILVFDNTQVYGISYEDLVKRIAEEIINSDASGIKGSGQNAEIFNDYINNKATGDYSHAEGNETIAMHVASHTEGEGTQTTYPGQHVQGCYNKIVIDRLNGVPLNYLHIVGNGSNDAARSNAHTLRNNGDAWFAGDIYIYGNSQVDNNAKRVPVVYVGNATTTPDNSIGKNGDIYCKLLQ